MEQFFLNALQGVVASGPVAALLLWRLWVADKRIKALEERIDKLVDDNTKRIDKLQADHTEFMKSLAGVEEE